MLAQFLRKNLNQQGSVNKGIGQSGLLKQISLKSKKRKKDQQGEKALVNPFPKKKWEEES